MPPHRILLLVLLLVVMRLLPGALGQRGPVQVCRVGYHPQHQQVVVDVPAQEAPVGVQGSQVGAGVAPWGSAGLGRTGNGADREKK